MTLVLVMLAGALGAPARFALERAVRHARPSTFPWGTWIVNISGSCALGVVAGLSARHGLAFSATAAAGSGFLGAYTTFSTFAVETVRAGRDGDLGVAIRYVATSVAVGVAAAIAGLAATGAF